MDDYKKFLKARKLCWSLIGVLDRTEMHKDVWNLWFLIQDRLDGCPFDECETPQKLPVSPEEFRDLISQQASHGGFKEVPDGDE